MLQQSAAETLSNDFNELRSPQKSRARFLHHIEDELQPHNLAFEGVRVLVLGLSLSEHLTNTLEENDCVVHV